MAQNSIARDVTAHSRKTRTPPTRRRRNRFCATAKALIAEVDSVRAAWRDRKLTDNQAIESLKAMHAALLAAGRRQS